MHGAVNNQYCLRAIRSLRLTTVVTWRLVSCLLAYLSGVCLAVLTSDLCRISYPFLLFLILQVPLILLILLFLKTQPAQVII